MAQVSTESVLLPAEETSRSATPDETADGPFDRPPKLKGRKRLLHSLQRIGSAGSLSRLSRSRSNSGYRGAGRGSVSCISLASSGMSYNHSFSSPFASDMSNGYSTAPTSVPGSGVATPAPDGPAKIRLATCEPVRSRTPLPAEAKFLAKQPSPIFEQDYFSLPSPKPKQRRENFDFWGDMPSELKMQILHYLSPKDIIRCSVVSKAWHRMCFDGQLWADLDTTDFYRDIPVDGLVKIIKHAGPFVRDLNLRGCIQLMGEWQNAKPFDHCRNLENISLEGCEIDQSSLHSFLHQNSRLVHINLSGLKIVTNHTLRIIAYKCNRLELLNISWCKGIDSRGVRRIIQGCHNLKDLRAGEVIGFDDLDLMNDMFESNKLERLMLMNCETLTDDSLRVLMEGTGDSPIDYLTGRRLVPPRRLRHLDLSRCRNVTDVGIQSLVGNVPSLEGLQLSKCRLLTDQSIIQLIPTMHMLTHLDLEELDLLSNATLQELATSPCTSTLQHLGISYCENLGDAGMLPVIKACVNLRNLDLDNTRISDLTLAEAAMMVRQRCSAPPSGSILAGPHIHSAMHTRSVTWDGSTAATVNRSPVKPKVGLRMVVYDCQNVTWTGIREVLSRNAEIRRPFPIAVASTDRLIPAESYNETNFPTVRARAATVGAPSAPPHPHQIISLKVFYNYQPTVTEHTRRVLRGDLASASSLERKWAEYMMASEEAGAAMGVGLGNGLGNANAALAGLGILGNRRRRRRVREAMGLYDEEEGLGGFGAAGLRAGRRRARSGGGCVVM